MSMISNSFSVSTKAPFTERAGTRAKISGFFARVPVGAKCRKHWQPWVIWLRAAFWRALTPDWAVLSTEKEYMICIYCPYINMFPYSLVATSKYRGYRAY